MTSLRTRKHDGTKERAKEPWFRAFVLSCSVVLSGCAADPPRAGGAQVGAQGGAPAKGDVELERLTTRLRDYVYATYEFDAGRDEPALERLRRAREALASAMTDAGLASKEQGLSGVVGALDRKSVV